jgi:acyl-CoA thioesterase I
MRKVYSLSILAGLVFAVSGCHGNTASNSAGDSKTGPAASSAPARGDLGNESSGGTATREVASEPVRSDDSRPVLVCFGDSLTAGLGTGPGQSYPDYLQADLDKLHYRYRVDNEGISGNTTKDGVERLPDILALHPAVVVVEFGGNDGLRGLRVEDTRANLDEIVGTLKKASIKVALAGITLPPDYGPDYIQKFDETYRVLANKYHVPLLPFLLKDVYGVPGMMQRDETHATAKGNVIVAKNVVSLVVPLLKR